VKNLFADHYESEILRCAQSERYCKKKTVRQKVASFLLEFRLHKQMPRVGFGKPPAERRQRMSMEPQGAQQTTAKSELLISERKTSNPEKTSSCCTPKEQESCCEPTAKAACCGTPDPATKPTSRCGCR